MEALQSSTSSLGRLETFSAKARGRVGREVQVPYFDGGGGVGMGGLDGRFGGFAGGAVAHSEDHGCGIEPDEVPCCFEAEATLEPVTMMVWSLKEWVG